MKIDLSIAYKVDFKGYNDLYRLSQDLWVHVNSTGRVNRVVGLELNYLEKNFQHSLEDDVNNDKYA